jgi:hypothetical protein
VGFFVLSGSCRLKILIWSSGLLGVIHTVTLLNTDSNLTNTRAGQNEGQEHNGKATVGRMKA